MWDEIRESSAFFYGKGIDKYRDLFALIRSYTGKNPFNNTDHAAMMYGNFQAAVSLNFIDFYQRFYLKILYCQNWQINN